MNRLLLPDSVCSDLEKLASLKKIYLEGNILKVIEPENGNESFKEYIDSAKQNDSNNRRKRLEVTKQIQQRNKELIQAKDTNENLVQELKEALQAAENATESAKNDLDVLQKKTQFELIGNIVRVALFVIVAVGVVVTMMYIFSMSIQSSETTLIGNTWSNLFGILLTNSFSIIGTIMGVKYANGNSDEGAKK